VPEEPLEDADRLLEAIDPDPGRIERDAGGVVLGLREARAEPELHASVREHVERRDLLCEHSRMPVVVRDHQARDAERLRGGGDGRERRQRLQLVPEWLLDEVIADQERGITGVLRSASGLEQGLTRSRVLGEYAEPKRSRGCHGVPGSRVLAFWGARRGEGLASGRRRRPET